jgi:hypothetical protein
MGMPYADCGAALGAGEAQFRYQHWQQAAAQSAYPGQLDWRPRWAMILQVSADASRDEIKRAYHVLAMLNHPDHGGSNDVMIDINKAYDEALAQLPEEKVS